MMRDSRAAGPRPRSGGAFQLGGPTVRRLTVTLTVLSAFLVALAGLWAADKDTEDTPKAAKTRKLLKTKVTVDFKDTPLSDVRDELKEQVKGLLMQIDNKGGVSNNTKFTYKAEDKPLDEVLDEMFKKNALGYIVISQKGAAYDGSIKIVKGNERGYPAKKD
jgi:hypothetical protein